MFQGHTYIENTPKLMSELSQDDLAALQQKFAGLRRQEYQLSQKIAELENERAEHECVTANGRLFVFV